MKIIQVNDVLTLDDDNEYLVLKILDLKEGNFYLLSKLDDDEPTDDVLIVTENSEYKIRMNMKNIKDMLPNYFKYSHKACIVNMNKVEAFDWKNYMIYFSNGTSTNLLSRSARARLSTRLPSSTKRTSRSISASSSCLSAC